MDYIVHFPEFVEPGPTNSGKLIRKQGGLQFGVIPGIMSSKMKTYTIDCVDRLEEFLKEMNTTCKGFNPDSDFRDFVDENGRPLFSQDQAAYLNRVLLECYRLCAREVIDIHLFHAKMEATGKK